MKPPFRNLAKPKPAANNPASAAVQAKFKQGLALHQEGRLAQAQELYQQVLKLQPKHFDALHLMGVIAVQTNNPLQAIELIGRAIEINPNDAAAYNNRGVALKDLKRLDEALKSYDRALKINPDYAEALSNMGTVLAEQGKRREALDCFRKALAIKPDYADARWKYVMAVIPTVAGPQEDPGAFRAEFSRGLAELDAWFDAERQDAHDTVGQSQPFFLAYQEQNNRELLSRYGTLCARLMKDWQDRQTFVPASIGPTRMVRVGIVSAHVRDHSVWTAIVKGWLQHMDRDRFELHVFHVGSWQDSETAWAKSHSTSFEQGTKELRQWVDAIQSKQPEALIYPEIGMDPMTANLASLRLAPVQVVSWGHPETSGLPTMDYYLSADALEPPKSQDNYTERLEMLPRLGCCYTPLPVTSTEPDFAALGIGAQGPVLLCPGKPFKYAPQYDSLLIQIARRLDRCRFVFFVSEVQELSEKLRQRLVFKFSESGLDFADYGVFIPWQNRAAFYGLMKRADVCLDTIGFSGFNTAMQAVECGLPIVTREGRFMRGRFASGILRSMGISELVAADEAGYVELAVKLASDAAYRQSIRRRIETSRGILFGDVTTVRALEDFLLKASKRN